MRRIVAIGGGEIEVTGQLSETFAIDKEIVRLASKDVPKLLFIPTASGDAKGYCEKVLRYFGDSLGCSVDFLLLSEVLDQESIKKKVFSADIIYVGGGNTLKMMRIWSEFGLDQILNEAEKRGKVLSGLSAGAICWFKYGHSDSNKLENSESPYIRVEGLNWLPFLLCPHYDAELERKPDLREMMKEVDEVAIALDNSCAIEIIDSNYRILTSRQGAVARKIFWLNDEYYEEVIQQDTRYRPITELSKKTISH